MVTGSQFMTTGHWHCIRWNGVTVHDLYNCCLLSSETVSQFMIITIKWNRVRIHALLVTLKWSSHSSWPSQQLVTIKWNRVTVHDLHNCWSLSKWSSHSSWPSQLLVTIKWNRITVHDLHNCWSLSSETGSQFMTFTTAGHYQVKQGHSSWPSGHYQLKSKYSPMERLQKLNEGYRYIHCALNMHTTCQHSLKMARPPQVYRNIHRARGQCPPQEKTRCLYLASLTLFPPVHNWTLLVSA